MSPLLHKELLLLQSKKGAQMLVEKSGVIGNKYFFVILFAENWILYLLVTPIFQLISDIHKAAFPALPRIPYPDTFLFFFQKALSIEQETRYPDH